MKFNKALTLFLIFTFAFQPLVFSGTEGSNTLPLGMAEETLLNLEREDMIALLKEARENSTLQFEDSELDQAIEKLQSASEQDLDDLKIALVQNQEVAIVELLSFGFAVISGTALFIWLLIALLA